MLHFTARRENFTMLRRILIASTTGCLILIGIGIGAFAQQGAAPAPQAKGGKGGGGKGGGKATRPPLFFKEEWKQGPAGGENPVGAVNVSNPNLELKLYGPSGKEMAVTGNAGDENNPIHLWTGLCTTACGAALRDKTNFADLTGLARIRWVTKMSGFHQIRPMIKLADGTWLVGDHADGSRTDWLQSEIPFSEVRWLKLDPERVVTTGDWVANPDLSKVDEIGFADLYPSSGHGPGGWADVAAVEVFAKPVPR
jgi:hypothetical protein